jgi:hypothetical protein
MADLSIEEKTRIKIPLLWLAGLLGFVFSTGAGIAMAQVRITTHDDRIANVERIAGATHELNARLSVVEEQNRQILKGQERMERKWERFERRVTDPQ